MLDTTDEKKAIALSLASLFSDCVECFGLIHSSKEWDRSQKLLLTQLGIQQARLLIWGDNLGVCEIGHARDHRLDDSNYRDDIERLLKSILDRPANVDRISQFEQHGLKPPKKSLGNPEPALDMARLEAFRERYRQLVKSRRAPSVIANHWAIYDDVKFHTFVLQVREAVDALIELMGNSRQVDQAMKYDIKALGWHPVFDRAKAANDGSKLRLIREACAVDYPEYAAATNGALAYLDKEWKDSYQEAMERGTFQSTTSEIPGSAAKMENLSRSVAEKHSFSADRQKLLRMFSQLRSKSWRRNPKPVQPSKKLTVGDSKPSSSQIAADGPDAPFMPTRSKSMGILPFRTKSSADEKSSTLDDSLVRIETEKSPGQDTIHPIASMVSRNDQRRASDT